MLKQIHPFIHTSASPSGRANKSDPIPNIKHHVINDSRSNSCHVVISKTKICAQEMRHYRRSRTFRVCLVLRCVHGSCTEMKQPAESKEMRGGYSLDGMHVGGGGVDDAIRLVVRQG
jgi:hypothetical protein